MVRDELRLYNPEYCTRPHVVALNKCDMFESPSDSSRLVAQLQDLASHLQVGRACAASPTADGRVWHSKVMAWAEQSSQCWRPMQP